MSTNINKPYVVLFVEGDTDKVFFDELLKYYRENTTKSLVSCEICNIRGVSKCTKKIKRKIEKEIGPKVRKKGFNITAVCCSYDTDIFEYNKHPVVDWNKVKNEIYNMNINKFHQIKVERMIEDWFLSDIEGLCKYLKIGQVTNLKGKNGYDKIQFLFKKGNRIYQKGTSVKKFINFLDIGIIRNKHIAELKGFESVLLVK